MAKSIYQIRRENLQLVIDLKFNGDRALMTKTVGFPSSCLLSRFLSAKPPKAIGDRVSRKLEQAVGLPEFAFDQPLPPSVRAWSVLR